MHFNIKISLYLKYEYENKYKSLFYIHLFDSYAATLIEINSG